MFHSWNVVSTYKQKINFVQYAVECYSSPSENQSKFRFAQCCGGGDRGAGDREKRGQEVYGRREKRGREAGFPRREKKGKITQHYVIFRNRKNAKGREPKNTGREPGLKGMGSGSFKPPCPPPPPPKLWSRNKHFFRGRGLRS